MINHSRLRFMIYFPDHRCPQVPEFDFEKEYLEDDPETRDGGPTRN